MGKNINTYRAYTSSEMKSRADIPGASDIVDNSTYITCSNISLAAVKNLLGASTYSLYDICRHANINKWSAFSPKVLTVPSIGMSGEITWNHPTTYKLGDFAGYNHGAITPSYYSNTHDDDAFTTNASESVQVEVQFDIGELILTNVESAMGIALAVFNGSTYITSASRALSTLTDQCRASNSRAFTVYVDGPSGSSYWYNIQTITYTFKLFLISGTSYSYNTNEIAKLFHVELPQFTKKIIRHFPTDIDWSVQPGMQYVSQSWYNPLVSFIVAATVPGNTYHVCINAVMYDYNNQQVGSSQNLYHGDVDYSGYTISNFDLSTVWGTIPSQDRYIRITTATHTYNASPPCSCS